MIVRKNRTTSGVDMDSCSDLQSSQHPSSRLSTTLFFVLFLSSLPRCLWSAEEVPTPIGKCDNGRMIVSLPPYAIPFSGIIHVRGFRSNPACFANSSSESFAPPSLNINLLASPTDPDFCGVVSLKDGREKAISVAIRAHSALELHEDKYFLLTCANLKTASRGSRQSKALREREEDGLVFYGLEEGHSRSSVAILGKSYYFGPREEKHLIGSCTAFGSRADSGAIVELLDSKACPSDAAIVNSVEFMTEEDGKSRKMKVKIKSMFRFPNQDFREPEKSKDSKARSSGDDEDDRWSDNRVTVQCTAVPCGGSPCPAPCSKEAGQLLQSSSATQSLVTASVHVLNPGMECDHEVQHQLTRDWLMALLFCLAILLLVMFCLNLFLCSAMACTCTKQEIVDTSSVDDERASGMHPGGGYDYDPYKTSDHPLYASLRKPQSMIEPGSRHHANPNYEIQRETYSVPAVTDHRHRNSSRHSNFY